MDDHLFPDAKLETILLRPPSDPVIRLHYRSHYKLLNILDNPQDPEYTTFISTLHATMHMVPGRSYFTVRDILSYQEY